MLDIVIATYNRLNLAKELAESIAGFNHEVLNRIIIVDSTQNVTSFPSFNYNRISYTHSSHQNQPYQRFLGFIQSSGEYVLFLDDDMQVYDSNFLKEIYKLFNEFDYAAIALKFIDKHQDTSLSKIPKTRLFKKDSKLKRIKNFLSGYNTPDVGMLDYNGVRGRQPIGGGLTEYVGGGAFVAQRRYLYKDFNFQLFDLYEKKLGKGEDAIIGYTLSKQHKVYFYDKVLFWHNDTNSSAYASNDFFFAKRVTMSRLFLSLEKARLDGSCLFKARLQYHYFTFWRILGYSVNYLLTFRVNRKNMLMGALSGWLTAITFIYQFSDLTKNYWLNEASIDSTRQ